MSLIISRKLRSKTFYISDGVAYRSRRMHKSALSPADKYYLYKTTNYIDKIWTFFTPFERSIPDRSNLSLTPH